MTGSPVLACRSDGSWNMSQPTCSKFSFYGNDPKLSNKFPRASSADPHHIVP